MVGLPGSGKSTFARRLAREIDAAVLESDALRRLLLGDPTHSAAESRRLFAALHEASRRLLTQGVSVIIDATNLKESDRRPAFESATETGARLQVIHFSAPWPVMAKRLAGRVRGMDPNDKSTADIGVYCRMAEEEQPLLHEHLRIDASDPVATESVFRRVVEVGLSDRQALPAGNAGR
jgi:predicted kinase